GATAVVAATARIVPTVPILAAVIRSRRAPLLNSRQTTAAAPNRVNRSNFYNIHPVGPPKAAIRYHGNFFWIPAYAGMSGDEIYPPGDGASAGSSAGTSRRFSRRAGIAR